VKTIIRLETDPVAHVGLEHPPTVPPRTSVREVLRLLHARHTGAVLVTELVAGREVLRGVFTERDALKRMARAAPLDVPIEEAMVRPAVTVSRDDTVGHAVRTMYEGGFRRLPVVDAEGHATGMVSVAGLLHYLVEHVSRVVYNLPPKPHHRTREQEGA
jgi:CBS domain-containing protein